jgi:glycosyltransferase involved in cell wall biosynthesis
MHILLNLYPWYLPRRNRELRTHIDLIGLSAIYPDMKFSLAHSIPAAMLGNAAWLAQYALGRTHLDRGLLQRSYLYHASTLLNWIPRSMIRRLRPDVLFGHEYLPFNITTRDLPIVFETAALTEEMGHYRPFCTPTQIRDHIRLNTRVKCRAISQATLVNIREPHGADQFRNQFPDLAHKVRTVPPFLQYISSLPSEQVIEKHAAPAKIKLLFVGNDAQRKGLPNLVTAIRGLPRELTSRLQLTVVSQFLDGPVDTAGIDARIISGGRITLGEAVGPTRAVIKQGPWTVNEVMTEMAASHIFVMPTLADTFGFVYLEAMANGCAVIGPDTQPQTWILDGGRAGMTVDPNSAEAVARAIKSLVANRELRTGLATAGLRRFHSTFAAPVVAARYHDLFVEAVEVHNRGSHPLNDFGLPKAG